jgi:hypothetical protein
VCFHGTIEKGRIIMYRRIGILSFSSPGHFYPLTALGRRLQSRGHNVVYFQVPDLGIAPAANISNWCGKRQSWHAVGTEKHARVWARELSPT